MDQGPDSKRARYSSAGTSWPAGSQLHGGPLPNPAPPPPSPSAPGHHPPPPSNPYQPAHPFSRSSDSAPPPPLSAPTSLPQPHPPSQHYDDRRHHESDQYPPMPDHRPPHHPPPSPAQGSPYPPYPRDPLVKRDPDGPELPHLRRPHSTGNAPENGPPGGVSMPHHSAPPPSHPDDRRHMSFDGGPSASPAVAPSHHPSHAPHSHPPPPPPPPPPGSSHAGMYAPRPPYPPNTSLPPQPPPQYDHPIYSPHEGMGYQVFASTTKRKAQRASQACDNCRSLKAKCDELKPCKTCKDKGLECKYRDPIPKQQDKVAADILDILTTLRDDLSTHRRDIDVRFDSIEKAMRKLDPSVNLIAARPAENHHQAAMPPPQPVEDNDSSPEGASMEIDPPSFPNTNKMSESEVRERIRHIEPEAEEEIVPGQLVPPGEPAMPAKHTTYASFLLTWPSIQERVDILLRTEGIKYVWEYPIAVEQKRGTIRNWGRGEGRERSSGDVREIYGEHTITSHAGAMTIEPPDDSYSDVSSSPQASDYHWGQTGGMSPGGPHVELKGTQLRPDGTPDFREEYVWKYVESYKQNIHIMHPLIYPKDLDALVQDFLERLPTERTTKTGPPPTARFTHGDEMVGTKRKRSPAADVTPPYSAPVKPGKPWRSVGSMIVLVVLALGKICLHKEKLPEVIPETEPPIQQSPQLRNGHPVSPAQGSPPSYSSHSQSSTLPSPRIDERALPNRRFSQSGQTATPVKPYSLKRNLDNIPGLEYFAIATDILGGHTGSASLKLVWANILMSLYQSQLARPCPAFEHIAHAGRTLLFLMRPDMKRFENMREKGGINSLTQGKRDNQLMIAFWTCLQLESDILAEIHMPQSGILAYEAQMPYPSISVMATQDLCKGIEATHYLAQLWLRKTLNNIHRELYATSQYYPRDGIPFQFSHIEEQLTPQNLFGSQPALMFTDEDPLSTDILSARLRAKYWGARVITFRPFIHMILNFNYRHKLIASGQEDPQNSKDNFNAPAPFRPGLPITRIEPDATEIPRDVIEHARKGIHALVQSTRAFHGLSEKRFIVTNVFGTAHAQWGNLLILEAVSRDPSLASSLQLDQLLGLFRKTIEFFDVISQKGSALMHDMNILKGLERDLHSRINRSSDYVSAMASPQSNATPGSLSYVRQSVDTPGSERQFASPPGPLPHPHPY